jgi:transposase
MREMDHIEAAEHNESFCAIWNSSLSHYKLALETFEESACGGYERPADRAVGAECAGASVLGEASPSSPFCASLPERYRAILRCADGLPSKFVAAELGIHEHTVGKWRRRFFKDRRDGLLDEAGRPRTINDDQVAAVIERTLRTTPVDAPHRSIRSMAAETGFSHITIRRVWATFGLQLHCSQTFKLSRDPLSSTRYAISSAFTCPRRTEPLSSASDQFTGGCCRTKNLNRINNRSKRIKKRGGDRSSEVNATACTSPLHDGEPLSRGFTTHWFDTRSFSHRAVNWNRADIRRQLQA